MRRPRATDVAFAVLFTAYAVGALGLLAQGAGSVLADRFEGLHAAWHLDAYDSGVWSRIAGRMADGSHHVPTLPAVTVGFVFSLLNLFLAGFILWLRPRDRTSRLLAVGLVGTAGIFNLTSQTTMEILPLTPLESAIQAVAHIVAGLAFVYALVLFPDGRPVPRWPWPALLVVYTPITLGAAWLALRVHGTARPATLVLFFGLVIPSVGVATQAYRFRWSRTSAEHQQSRLLFWALLPTLGIGLYFLSAFGPGVTDVGLAGRHLTDQPVIVFRIFQPVFALLPLALFIGLIRYRLWDVDRVVNRTLVYTLATAALAGTYWGIVVLLQRAFGSFTQGNEIAVATSTLVVAAAFGTVRTQVQSFVDRRFYRSHYDAVQTVERFSTALKGAIDLDSLTTELRGAVSGTMQPRHVSLMLREPTGGMTWQWTYRPGGSTR